MKILFITDNFPPEVNAPASRTYEHCKEWVKDGQSVTVVTCTPNYPQGKVYAGYKNKLYQTELIDGIKVIRVWSFIAPNKGLFKRTFDFISFAISSFFVGLFIKTDIIIATSPQLFSAVSGRMLSLFKRKPWVMEVRDLWPESIITLGILKSKKIIKFFEALEMNLYRSASKIIVVTDTFKERIASRGTSLDKIKVFKNGVNLEKFFPTKKNEIICKDLNLNGKVVIGYLGTHGISHSLSFILNSVAHVKDNNIQFLFIGDGAEKETLMELASELKLKNVTFYPSVPKEKIEAYLSVIDISLVPLKRTDTFKTVIPSKIFESAAMRKPILLGVEGESKELIEHYNAGLCFIPEDRTDFLEKLDKIIDQKEDFNSGLDRLALEFNRTTIAKDMLKELKKL